MCGRYSLSTDLGFLAERFEFPVPEALPERRYNIAPTDPVLAVTNSHGRRAELLRWGLVPFWATSLSTGAKMINARAETVAGRPVFSQALQKRRCLVLADGFYEWRKDAGVRTPFRFVLKSREPFAFAGIWAIWKSPQGEWVRSCSIITCPPNELMRPIHDRMPVILREELEDLWLDQAVDDPAALTPLLSPYPSKMMDAYAVSPLVNSVKNDEPACLLPV